MIFRFFQNFSKRFKGSPGALGDIIRARGSPPETTPHTTSALKSRVDDNWYSTAELRIRENIENPEKTRFSGDLDSM